MSVRQVAFLFGGRCAGLLATLVLGACGTPDETHLTVEYYRAHAAERQRMVQSCANDPGNLKSTRACINAREAARIEDVGSLRDLAPMGLPANPNARSDGRGPR